MEQKHGSHPAIEPTNKNGVESPENSAYVLAKNPVVTPSDNLVAQNITTVGDISFYKSIKLGSGSHGTTVHRGSFINNMPVAVKRVLKEAHYDEREIGHLLAITQENVVRYMGKEEDEDFIYIALELCDFTLENYITAENQPFDLKYRKNMLFQITNGLSFLHTNQILHRDLKPKNILLKGRVIKLSDFGLSRQMEEDRSSITVTNTGAGSKGWRAPEILIGKQGTKMTKAVDIFALGCIFHYVLAESGRVEQQHPFGDDIHREVHIKNGRRHVYISQINKKLSNENIIADILISQSIIKIPGERPSIQTILKHPIFWTPSHTMNFFVTIHNSVIKERITDDNLLYNFEQYWQYTYKLIYPQANKPFGWIGEINKYHSYFVDHVIRPKRSKSKYSSLQPKDLLRLIRNINQHSPEILAQHPYLVPMFKLYGNPINPDGIIKYFLNTFPVFLIIVYNLSMQVYNMDRQLAESNSNGCLLDDWLSDDATFHQGELKKVTFRYNDDTDDITITRQLDRVMKLIKLLNKCR